jgi:hypothetical protein
MKLLPRLLISCVAALAAWPALAFEGKVHFETTTGRNKQQMVYTLKGDKARFDMPDAQGAAGILDLTTQEMLMLMPEQKMYMVMSLQGAVESAQKHGGGSDVTIEDTGETETILGRKTKKYKVSDRNTTTFVWAAEGMGTFMGQMGGGNPMRGKAAQMPAWQRELGNKGFFPLRVVGQDRRGRETHRMEATKIEEVTPPDSAFQVPEGYQRFDMGSMMRGLIPGSK